MSLSALWHYEDLKDRYEAPGDNEGIWGLIHRPFDCLLKALWR